MWQFFLLAENLGQNTSPADVERRFREQNLSGVIEKEFSPESKAVLVFGRGTPAGAYQIQAGVCRAISLADFSAKEGHTNLRAIELPDQAGRSVWLSLDSVPEDNFSLYTENDWKQKLDEWQASQWTGLAEVSASSYHGLALFWRGVPQRSDVIFSTAHGFAESFPFSHSFGDQPLQVTAYAPQRATNSFECLILRQASTHWADLVLKRYQEIVGTKLLRVMSREVERAIQPWDWHITLEGTSAIDTHFFSFTSMAAHAYRAIFMVLGAQMNFVIGNTLTQRILYEAFDNMQPDERVALQAQRLIPAAFTE